MSIENFIWYEKHRPRTIKALSLPPTYSVAFDSYIKEGQIPHLLLVGQAGSGKTTIGKIIMDSIPCTRLELNASSKERGIDTVKGTIKEFASSQPRKGEMKICFLDEADGLTADALDALKGTMEKYSKNCRFILTANNLDKITPPIRSRCTIFTFDQFSKEKLAILCKRILAKENVTVKSEKDIGSVVEKYYPDVRSTINNLQLACHSGTLELSVLIALKVDPTKIGELLKKGHIFSLRSYIANVTDYTPIYRWLYDSFVAENGDSDQKGEMVLSISDALAIDKQVPDREINFISACLGIMGALGVKWNFDK